MSVSRPAIRKIKATLLHHTTLITGYLVNLRGTSTGADDNIFHIKTEITTIISLLSQLNGNYDEETQENIKAIIVTGKRIFRHRERKSILSSQQTFEDWIAEISSLKLDLIQSNGKEIEYSAERPIRVFLSYSTTDNKLVGEIKEKLESSGIEAFLAHEDIEPSEDWIEIIILNLKECDVFIPFLSENFKKSKWTDQESGIAFTRDKLIIPINIGLVPYGFIGKYQTLPYENSSDACEKIIETMMKKNPLMKKRIQDDLRKKHDAARTRAQRPRLLRIQLNRVWLLFQDIERMEGTVNEEVLFASLLSDHGINRTEASKLLGILRSDGMIYSPNPGYYKKR